MRKLEETLIPGQPTLELLYAKTEKKYRPLDCDVIVLGRARGCDVGLDAPDVSTVHCVISRISGGFRVRDCASRAGTRINGETVHEADLHDDDVLQVGPFSFRVHLTETDQPGDTAGAGDAALHEQLAALRQRVREYEDRNRKLEEAEREVARDRELLNRETADLDARMQQTEEELTRRKTEADAEIVRRREEFEREAQQREGQLKAAEEAAEAAARERECREHPQRADPAADQEELGRVEGLRHELNERRRLLDERERRLAGNQELLTRGLHTMKHEHAESVKAREEWAGEQAEMSTRLAAQKASITQAEVTLREQRSELVQMMAELKQLQESLRQQESEELQALRHENQQLRDEFAQLQEAPDEREQLREAQQQAVAERDQALAECDRLQAACAQLQAEGGPPPAADDTSKDQEALREEIAFLRGLLQEKDALLEEVQAPRERSLTESDMEGYEAELNQFRLQLESDRQKLNKDIQQLRARNTEIDEAKRELELEMSKERAELARERTRLERLRDEMRQEIERVQREGGVRERLAPVQRLREEMSERRQPPSTPRPGQPADQPLDARLKSLRERINEESICE
jgi:pSer/pThr/pTyr-binding forkhead associated (FHA) protein